MAGSRLHVPWNLPGPAHHHVALGVAFLGHPLPRSHMPGLCPDTSLLPQVLNSFDFPAPSSAWWEEVSSHHVCGWRETCWLQCL